MWSVQDDANQITFTPWWVEPWLGVDPMQLAALDDIHIKPPQTLSKTYDLSATDLNHRNERLACKCKRNGNRNTGVRCKPLHSLQYVHTHTHTQYTLEILCKRVNTGDRIGCRCHLCGTFLWHPIGSPLPLMISEPDGSPACTAMFSTCLSHLLFKCVKRVREVVEASSTPHISSFIASPYRKGITV